MQDHPLLPVEKKKLPRRLTQGITNENCFVPACMKIVLSLPVFSSSVRFNIYRISPFFFINGGFGCFVFLCLSFARWKLFFEVQLRSRRNLFAFFSSLPRKSRVWPFLCKRSDETQHQVSCYTRFFFFIRNQFIRNQAEFFSKN